MAAFLLQQNRANSIYYLALYRKVCLLLIYALEVIYTFAFLCYNYYEMVVCCMSLPNAAFREMVLVT